MAASSRCAQNEQPVTCVESKTKKELQKEFDRALLIEVAAVNPFHLGNMKKGAGWKEVADQLTDHLGQPVTERRVWERTDDMVKTFKKKDTIQKTKSGIDEDFTEEDKLLMDIMQMRAAADEEKATINKGAGHDKEIRDKGKEILEKALAGRVEKSPDLDPGTLAKRPKMEMLNFFKEKEEKQTTFRNEQMSLMKEDFTLRLQNEEARTKKAEEEKRMQLEELKMKERMAEEDRKLRREEMAHAAKREEEERKLRIKEMHLRDAREREAAERHASLFSELLKTLAEKK